eukprot:TRINITY_DN17412_c0_g2_i1.p2 TRINITY_DN17412_c0_g2~~TRINITY_DN17412_c0_g2_i1.p2  ORF type:complete len:124 (+),score=9.16 TRINITY_DN17412_c0_g2_i1:109-480(+)
MCKVHDITVTVASGNNASDSCQVSPANVESTITVGGSDLQSKFTNIQTESDLEDTFQNGNTGACVDLFAPCVDIYGACGGYKKCIFVHDTTQCCCSIFRRISGGQTLASKRGASSIFDTRQNS